MSPRQVSENVMREAPVLASDDRVGDAVRVLLDSGLPGLPVVEAGRLVGIFGEREFMAALFPGYVKELPYAGFVPHALDDSLAKRAECAAEPIANYMHTEHVEVGGEFSDLEVAENFLHHRVLIVPVVEEGRVIGVITRADFFRLLAERFLAQREEDDGSK